MTIESCHWTLLLIGVASMCICVRSIENCVDSVNNFGDIAIFFSEQLLCVATTSINIIEMILYYRMDFMHAYDCMPVECGYHRHSIIDHWE